MIKWTSDPENLKRVMILMRDKSHGVAKEALTVFKVRKGALLIKRPDGRLLTILCCCRSLCLVPTKHRLLSTFL